MTYASTFERSSAGPLSLAEKVMGLTSLLFLLAVAGVGIGWNGANQGVGVSSHFLLWMIAEFGLLIATMLLASSPAGLACFAGFGLVTGITLAPLLHTMTALGQGGVIVQAVAATGLITVGLTVYARTTTRDYSGMGGYLFAAVIGLVVASLLGFLFHSTVFQMVISVGATIIFSLFLVYNVQQVTSQPNNQRSAVLLALNIYLNIFNIFVSLLSILSNEER